MKSILGWALTALGAAALAGSSYPLLKPPSETTAAPYPPSATIAGVEFDFSSHDRRAPGSDNWNVTWADDGHQYTCWGDGGGFGGSNGRGRVSLGVARLEGSLEELRGVNVYGGWQPDAEAKFGGKSYGILSVAGVLYLWVGPGSGTASYAESRLYRSSDRGLSWEAADWAFRKKDGWITPFFCQYGADLAGAPDAYVYTYFIRLENDQELDVQTPGAIDLTRVPRDRIFERAAYEYFAGLEKGQPKWSRDRAARRPVFEDAAGVGWCASISYNPGLERYLLATEHRKTMEGQLGLFDAPSPWGPWTTVLYTSNWGRLGPTFYWNFSNKWLSKDGLEFVVVFTGVKIHDAWNTVRGRFVRKAAGG